MAKKSSKKKTVKSKKSLTYADAGVNIQEGDRMVGLIKGHMHRTYSDRVMGKHGGFAGMFRLDNNPMFARNYKKPVLVSCADGVGSKVMLAAELGICDTMGQDVVAMNVNDMIVQGAEPLFFLDYIGTHKLDPEKMTDIVKGVADGCKLAGCALLGGETAELPDIYQPGDFDLAGFAVGVCEMDQIIDGSRAKAGDIILGLRSSGVHSNGFTLVRQIIKHAALDLNQTYEQLEDDRTLGQILLTPTRIYSKQVINVLRSYKNAPPVTAMAHITGGGMAGNIPRVLGDRLNAKFSKRLWNKAGDPAVRKLFNFLQEQGNVDYDEMMRVFNMGIGYVLVVKPRSVGRIIKLFQAEGLTVDELGKITPGTGKFSF